MEENKIGLIIYKKQNADDQLLMEQINSLKIPFISGSPAEVEIVTVAGDGNRAAAYNAGMRQCQARYKVYLDTSLIYLHPDLLQVIMRTFELVDHAGMVGVWGSSLPLDGDFRKAKRQYGHVAWADANGNVKHMVGDAATFYQRVQAVDGTCLATCVDLPWDEDVDEAYLATAHALALARQRFGTYVPVLMDHRMLFITTHLPAHFWPDSPAFEQARQRFMARYAETVQPLVSIMIPAYNQPEYCRLALESALAQDYPRIEILIGDDSTDQRVHEAIAPLLAQHENIQYSYRGNLPGEDAMKNIDFLLNACHGDFVNLLFHDDIIYPTKISKMMAYFAEDIDEEIAFATSRRAFMDAEGRSDGVYGGLGGSHDAVFSGRQLCRKMLLYQTNIVGEHSTVLLRKSLLWRGQDYKIGIFYGYADPSMGDISTWMELLRDGHTCVFLHDVLSAFRNHPAQNTYHPDTMLLCYLDWLNFFVLAYLHRMYLFKKEEFVACCKEWRRRYEPCQGIVANMTSPAKKAARDVYQQALAAIRREDYESVIQLCINYMASTGADPKEFLKGTDNQWNA